MNGNQASTASVQPSGGSVVDGPSASTITFTSPSSNGGARTTSSEDDSASQSNGETQLSEQMQQLSIRQDTTIQSNQPSLPELRAYCQSDSLTEHGLRERLSRLNLQVEDSTYGILLIDVCANDCVTHEIVQCVIDHVSGAASVKTTGGRTPLNVVCRNKNVTLDIFRCVIDSYPGALRTQDEFGMTPLFSLCCNRRVDETVSVEILTFFLETCPESALCSTHDGDLPIHFACRNRSPEFCWKLIQAYPKSIRHEALGEPLLYYVLFTSSVDDSVALAVLKMLLEKHSDMVRDVRWNGQSLLQYAASTHLPRNVEVCRLLIRAFPELLELVESTGQQLQPLNIACLYGNLPVVKCILDMHPDAIRGESSIGSFPIHVAVSALRKKPQEAVEVVKFLLTFDHSVAAQEVNGSYPLIWACLETNASNLSSGLEVIKLLYNAYPEAIVNAEASLRQLIDINETPDDVKYFLVDQLHYATQASLQLVRTRDENGMLPLHRALLEVAPLGAVKLLVQADLSTLQIPDNRGALPSHIACEHHECPDVVKYLVGLYTRSLLVADNRGNTPLHCACLAVNYDVIEMILLQYPNAPVDVRNLNLNDGNGDGNGDLPIQILLGYDDDESVGYASCIYLLLRANPEMWMSNENLVLALTSDS
eukprot:scaffold2166_cov100-Skeletonema_marinoi.AAC.4